MVKIEFEPFYTFILSNTLRDKDGPEGLSSKLADKKNIKLSERGVGL